MVDGPHRSLPMSRSWKQLARRAANTAFSPEEVRDAVPAALESDWRAEVPTKLVGLVDSVVTNTQGSLFDDQRVDKLEALRREAAGSSLGNSFLDCAIQAVVQDRNGDDAMQWAVAHAIADRAARRARQVEEHYFRESTNARASEVRERIENGVVQADFMAIAGRLVGLNAREQPVAPAKKTGLDDGVRF